MNRKNFIKDIKLISEVLEVCQKIEKIQKGECHDYTFFDKKFYVIRYE